MANYSITNLVTIKNYPAGRNGNLLVSLDEKLENTQVWNYQKGFWKFKKDKESKIRMLVAIVYVDEEGEKVLQSKVDKKTSSDAVLVVSKKFMKLPNKVQLAILCRQNLLYHNVMLEESSADAIINADVEVASRFGKHVAKRALEEERELREKDSLKAGQRIYKEARKGSRAFFRKGNQAKETGFEFEDDEEYNKDDFEDILEDEVSEESTSESISTDKKISEAQDQNLSKPENADQQHPEQVTEASQTHQKETKKQQRKSSQQSQKKEEKVTPQEQQQGEALAPA